MREKAINLIRSPLISGSIALSIGGLIGNFINFIFNVFISRNLSVDDYGTVASLTAIITLLGISAGAIIPTMVNFTSESFQKNDLQNVRSVYFKIAKPFALISLGVFLFFSLFSHNIAIFLNIENGDFLVFLAGLIVFFGFISVLNHALFQARLSFIGFSLLNISAAVLKLLFGAALILSGYKAVGAMFAVLIAYVAPYFVSFLSLRFLFGRKDEGVKVSLKEIIKYAAPSGLALLALTSISSTDLVLVKHLFAPNEAGVYAGLSLVGRVIFFFTAPIGVVMFALMSRSNKKQDHKGMLVLSGVLVIFASVLITIFYFTFPQLVIKLFLRNDIYLSAVPYLGQFGIFISFYSLCSLMMYYYLSLGQTWIYKPILAAAILQGALIYMYHNTFSEIILISIVTTLSLLVFLAGYLFLAKRGIEQT